MDNELKGALQIMSCLIASLFKAETQTEIEVRMARRNKPFGEVFIQSCGGKFNFFAIAEDTPLGQEFMRICGENGLLVEGKQTHSSRIAWCFENMPGFDE